MVITTKRIGGQKERKADDIGFEQKICFQVKFGQTQLMATILRITLTWPGMRAALKNSSLVPAIVSAMINNRGEAYFAFRILVSFADLLKK